MKKLLLFGSCILLAVAIAMPLAALAIQPDAESEKPFFAYYAGKGNHFWGAHPDFMNQPAGTNNSAQMAEHDHNVGRLLDKLIELGIAENTLVI